jgi:ethanolamine utilization microcompartment shell protein EutS
MDNSDFIIAQWFGPNTAVILGASRAIPLALIFCAALSAQTNSLPASGSVGIGTINPQAPLQIGTDLSLKSGWPAIGFNAYYNTSGSMIYYGTNSASIVQQDYSNGGLGIWTAPSGTAGTVVAFNEAIFIGGAGRVGIGTTNPQQLFDVAGTMSAREDIVTQTGADYVFEPGYRLAPLNEVAEYIKQNHHLPDVPSAEEMLKTGASVGEMQATLLAKVEELTLHMIELEHENSELKQSVRKLQETVPQPAGDHTRHGGIKR